MKFKVVSYSILVIFLLSFLAPFISYGQAAENEKPQVGYEKNDELDSVLTGVKVVTGTADSLINKTELMLDLENNTSGTKPTVGYRSFLITAGVAKVLGDATESTDSKVSKVSLLVGDVGDITGKTTDAGVVIKSTYNGLNASNAASNVNIAKQFWETTKATYSGIKTSISTGLGGMSYLDSMRMTGGNVIQHVKGLGVLNKIFAPLAVVGAGLDFAEAGQVAKDRTKNGYDLSEKILSGVSNVLVVGALLAAGTAAAPLLAVGALATGATALIIKYKEPLGRWAKAAGGWIASKATSIGKKAKETYQSITQSVSSTVKKGIGAAVVTGIALAPKIKKAAGKAYQAAKNTYNKAKATATKAKSTVTKAGKAVKNTAKKAYQFAKNTVDKGKKLIVKVKNAVTNAKKTISTAAKKVTNFVKSAAKKTVTAAAKKVTSTVKSAAKKTVAAAKKVTSTVKSAAKKTVAAAKKVTNTVKSAAKKTVAAAKKVTSSVKNAAKKTVTAAA
ncbi:hypothetical protein, partial [Halalkalibacter alkalisediminis]